MPSPFPSSIVLAKKRVASGTRTSTATMPKMCPRRSVGDGVPCQSVSSRTGGGGAPPIGVVPAGEGRPQCGQAVASVETSRLQSGQVITGMRGLSQNRRMGVLAKEIEATYEVLAKMGEGGMGAV